MWPTNVFTVFAGLCLHVPCYSVRPNKICSQTDTTRELLMIMLIFQCCLLVLSCQVFCFLCGATSICFVRHDVGLFSFCMLLH